MFIELELWEEQPGADGQLLSLGAWQSAHPLVQRDVSARQT